MSTGAHSLEDELAATPAIEFADEPHDVPHRVDYAADMDPRDDHGAPAPRDKGGRVVFSADLMSGGAANGEGGASGTTISFVDDDEEDLRPRRGPARPLPPTSVAPATAAVAAGATVPSGGTGGERGARGAGDVAPPKPPAVRTKPDTAFAQMKASFPLDLVDMLEEHHARAAAAGVKDDDIVWQIAHGVLAPLLVIRTLPERLARQTERAAEASAERIADAAGSLNADHVGDRIVARIAPKLSEALERDMLQPAAKRLGIEVSRHRWRWVGLGVGGGAVLPAIAMIVGFMLGRSADVSGYREEYVRKAAQLPTIAAFVKNDVGERVYGLALRNPDSVLTALTTCAPELGLRIVKSTTGERVCTGGPGARSAWRLP